MTRTTSGASRLATILLLIALALPVFSQSSSRAKSIGGRLWCMCGCNQILTQCNHVGCSTSTTMLKKLDGLVERGDSDDLIIQAFIQEYGTQVQSQPPAQGFALMSYALPTVMLLAGAGIVIVLIQHWRRAPAAAAPAAPGTPRIPAEMLERARRRANEETDLDAESTVGDR